MQTKYRTKQNILPKAWLVSWVAFGDEERIFKRHGIKNRVIDVLGARVRHNDLRDVVGEYYIQNVLTLTERLPFQHYTQGGERKQSVLRSTPSFSSYGSQEYKNVMEDSTAENREAWVKYPKYYRIGHEPMIEIREVHDFEWKEVGGEVCLSWSQDNADGTVSCKTAIYAN